ncbi:response regulator receiver domain protein [Clostridium sp. CAG:1000]|jgi:two-component system response regulator ResD|nr:response regulator receiver domain protein [Clostridium sp. CAG:1000]
MKVLIVDDEKLIRDVIKEYCLGNKYEILEADNGIDAIKKAAEADIIVMDIMMPKMDGFTAYKEIKKKYNTPTIILSARGEEYDKLVGFDLGIDDYMTKPFSPKELIARINAVCKRYKKDENFFEYKGLKVDYLGHCVFIDGNEINLTPKEYDLLVYFIKNKGIALSREQLLNKIWNYDYFGNDRTIDTHIKMLRNNLREYRNLIITVRGMGYKFDCK